MSCPKETAIRVLVADDEAEVLDAYKRILEKPSFFREAGRHSLGDLRAKIFGGGKRESGAPCSPPRFQVEYTRSSREALQAMKEARERGVPFHVAFLDMRMPPGPDGAWVARQMRAIDSTLDIVFVTAYSDMDPQEISGQIPPADKIFYLQKPFHPHEIRQLALALGCESSEEAKIRELAYYDRLTGLPNRDHFTSRLLQAIELARRQKRRLAVLMLDLDNFKRINDTLGHNAGDRLLRIIARRLTASMRCSDTITRLPLGKDHKDLARLGGDEFMILLSEVVKNEDAAIVANRIGKVLCEPVPLGEDEIIVNTSMGIAVFPEDGEDAETLVKNADMAMHLAKKEGGNSFRYFSPSLNVAAGRRLKLENELRRALHRGEFSLWYQPQIHSFTGELLGMEALIRWQSPALGMVSPMEFIPVAEECGLITSIGQWVLTTACAQARTWRRKEHPLKRMAVNISVLQFLQQGFPQLVEKILAQSGLEAEALELEITETMLMKDADNSIQKLEALKSLGVSLAIDDFGTGYSSLSRLKDFPIDRIKIDKSFVHGISSAQNEKAIAAAIIAMGHSMGLHVTAEGVETQDQLDYLRDNHCEEIQGYLISRPLPPCEAVTFLKNRNTLQAARFRRISRDSQCLKGSLHRK